MYFAAKHVNSCRKCDEINKSRAKNVINVVKSRAKNVISTI